MVAEKARRELIAVIDIGSSAIRMVIAEVGPDRAIRILEQLQKDVALGKDVFTTGRISRNLVRKGIAVLKDYKNLLDEYGVKVCHAIATIALREAENRDYFIDQIYVRTGIDVEVIEGGEQIRLEMIAVEHALKGRVDLDKENSLIIEVGSGGTVLIILNRGEIELTHTLPIGSVRLPEDAIVGRTDLDTLRRVLKTSIHDAAQLSGREHALGDIGIFIALGREIRAAARELAPAAEKDLVFIDNEAFFGFVDRLAQLRPEEVAEKYRLTYAEAETFYPALLFYRYFLAETKATRLVVPMVSIRDGLLLEEAQLISGNRRTDVSRLVISAARRLGAKYHYDEKHALCVASLALTLFDKLREDHGLGARERLLLHVAAILHDIGSYIAPRGCHKHSGYLISASELFGLRQLDREIVASVARYHRGSMPSRSHGAYQSLSKRDRATVSKLAAILRVAKALDKSNQQKIRDFALERSSNPYVIWVGEDVADISVEQDALEKGGEMFGEVFGTKIVLKKATQARS